MPSSAPVLTYRAKELASNIQSKVLKVHNTLININITAISAPEMTYTPIIIGLWTRAASFVLAVNMIVAILTAHLGVLFSVDATTGGSLVELPMLYLLGATALCFTGGGKYAITKGTLFD